MPVTDTHTIEALQAYTEALFAQEDELLRRLRADKEASGFPRIHVSPAQGRLLQLLLRAVGARRVLEIGTLGGYSAIWMARALPEGGQLLTLELAEERAAFARDYVRRAGLGGRVEVRAGPAADTLHTLVAKGEEGRFDACFIDADKESYPAYLHWARRLVRRGGLILADNVFWSGRVLDDPSDDEGTRAIQQFNRSLARDGGVDATLVPIGDGLALALVTGEATGSSTSGA